MKFRPLLPFALLSAVLFCACPIYAAERTPVKIDADSPLSLRVLTRPGATLYSDASGTTALDSNLPSFKPYFVYIRPEGESRESGTGWYEVGSDEKGGVVGWMKASDVFEWRQTMCLTYTHPQGRHPVLMFEEEETASTLAGKKTEERKVLAQAFYDAIDQAASKPLPEDFPVISVEPKMAVDAIKQFYLLPILEHQSVEIDGREGRLLRLAAVSGKADPDKGKSDIRANAEYAKAATADAETATPVVKELLVDVVWVMDTTRSMGPYIDAARHVLEKTSASIAVKPALKERLAFGAWLYRDSTEIKDIEYTTLNLTPKLLSVDAFLTALNQAKETKVDSVDVAEDMFAGVADAINKTSWRDGAIRVVLLVGDAPSHKAGHKWNSSGLEESTLRALANENKVTVLALHINPPSTKKYNRLAAAQFKTLAQNPGTETPMYWSIGVKDPNAFNTLSETITSSVLTYVEEAMKGEALAVNASVATKQTEANSATVSSGNPVPVAPATPSVSTAKNAPSSDDIRKALQAATVTWVGSRVNAEPPRDIEAWVLDKDLTDSSIQSLEVRLLLSKRQLDALATLLNDTIEAGRKSQMETQDFFTALQAASAAASRNADMLAKAGTLAKSGLIPAFLTGLPYHSQLMDMSDELWASWSPDEQDAFLNSLEAKINAYAAIHDDPEKWVALNAGDDPDDFVTPILLDLLP